MSTTVSSISLALTASPFVKVNPDKLSAKICATSSLSETSVKICPCTPTLTSLVAVAVLPAASVAVYVII